MSTNTFQLQYMRYLTDFLCIFTNPVNANKSAKYIHTTLDKAFNAKANAFVHNNLLFVQYITTL